MSILGIILLVLFCIIALLLIFLVAIQGENSVGLGGIFGGSSESAFGSNTSSVLTRATTIITIAFMVLSLVVAVVNKSSDEELLAAQSAAEASAVESTSWVDETEPAAAEADVAAAEVSAETAAE